MNNKLRLFLILVALLLCLYFSLPTFITEYRTVAQDELPDTQQVFSWTAKKSNAPELSESKIGHLENQETDSISMPFILPQNVIDDVKTFVFFLGHGHSGHSIVASIMDSHPHMVISHEVDIFDKISSGHLAATKTEIFNAVWRNTVETIIDGIRSKNQKGYNLTVSNLYAGKYVDYIEVIGDKKGSKTTKMLWKYPEQWEKVLNILRSFDVTLKVITVFRNPYDIIGSNIVADYIYKSDEKFAKIKQTTEAISPSPENINASVNEYFSDLQVIVNGIEQYKLDVVVVHNRDIISDPKGAILKLCNDLGVACSDTYLEKCSNKIYNNPSRTRHLITWTDKYLRMVQQNIEKISYLKGYSFDSL